MWPALGKFMPNNVLKWPVSSGYNGEKKLQLKNKDTFPWVQQLDMVEKELFF